LLFTTALVLLGLWLLGLINSHTWGGSIHILLAVAVVMFVVNAVRERDAQ